MLSENEVIGMHPDHTEEWHADFDGDESHLYFVTGEKAEFECEIGVLFTGGEPHPGAYG